jgi:hypothetical protein
MKTIILTTRITENEFNNYARDIAQNNITINNYTYYYRKINIETEPNIIILLDGLRLGTSPISIGNLIQFDAQQVRRQEISTFLQLINELANKENFYVDENLIFAIHWGRATVDQSREYTENFKKWVKKYDEKVNFIITFWTTAAATPEPDSKIDEKLREATPDISDETFELWFDTLKTRDIPLTTKFSNIKHHIMTSFLDLDIDWQGIKEVNEKDKESAKKYLNAILEKKLEKKSKNYYCQKLVNLWFYLTGNKDLKIESIHSSLEKDKLPYKKSVLDLINELDNDRKNNLKEKWTNLLSHVGLNVNLNDPYNIEKIEKGKESLIIFYLQNLDLMSQQNKEDKNVNIFLGKFEKKEDSKKEKEIIYFNFHEWYLKLGDLLEELKSFLE